MVTTNICALVTIDGGCLAAVFFGYRTFDGFQLIATYCILLITAYDVCLVAADGGLLVCLDIGNLGIEVFRFRSLHIDSPVSGYGDGLAARYRMGLITAHLCGEVRLVVFGDLAGDSSRHFAAYGGGHIAGSLIDDILCIIGDSSILCSIGDISGSGIGNILRFVGNGAADGRIGNAIGIHHGLYSRAVTDLAGNGGGAFVQNLIGIIGNGAIRCGAGDVIGILFDGGLAVPFFHALKNLLQILGDIGLIEDIAIVIFQGNLGIRGICRGLSHIGLVAFHYGVGHFVFIFTILGNFPGSIICRIVSGVGEGLLHAVCGNRAGADGFVIPCPNGAAGFIHLGGACLDFAGLREFEVLGGHIAAVDFGVVIFIELAGKGLSVEFAIDGEILFNGQVATNRSIAGGFQGTGLHIPSLYRARGLDGAAACIEACGRNLTSGIYLKGAISCAQSTNRFDVAITVDGGIAIGRFHCAVTVNGELAISPFNRTIAVDIEFAIGTFNGAIGAQGHFTIGCRDTTVAVDCEVAIGCLEGAIGIQGNLAIDCSNSTIAVYGKVAIGCLEGAIGVQSNLATGCSNSAVTVYSEVVICYAQCALSSNVSIGNNVAAVAYGHVSITHVEAVGFHNARSSVQFDLVVYIDRTIRTVNREFAICPFDGTIGLHGCLGFIVGVSAGVNAVFIHDRAVCADLDTTFVHGNLIIVPFVQDHFIGVGLGSSYIAFGVDGGGILLENVVTAQAEAAVDGLHQFCIRCNAGFLLCRNLLIQFLVFRCPGSSFSIDIFLQLRICFLPSSCFCRVGCFTSRCFILQTLVQGIQVLAYIFIGLHILAILHCSIGDTFGSGEFTIHHDCSGVFIIGNGFGLGFEIRGPGVKSFICRFASCRFIINICLQLFICIFQICYGIFTLTSFCIDSFLQLRICFCTVHFFSCNPIG